MTSLRDLSGLALGLLRGERLAFFLHLHTDPELLLPVISAVGHAGWRGRVAVYVTRELIENYSGARMRLREQSIKYTLVDKGEVIAGRSPPLAGVRAVVTATETTLRPHRAAHELVSRANARGIPTITLQHGLDNVGLTYSDEVQEIESVRFASRVILTWGKAERLHDRIPPDTRLKCVPVGCPKYPHERPRPDPAPAERTVAVFENLHWQRYPRAMADAFLRDLGATASAATGTQFVVKPHPAGRWLTERYRGPKSFPGNVTIVDPTRTAAPEHETPKLIRRSLGVITTPSTIALDAAWEGRPIAVAGYDVDTCTYAPLPKLAGPEDWVRFVTGIDTPAIRRELIALSLRFVDAALLPGDGAANAARVIAREAQRARNPLVCS